MYDSNLGRCDKVNIEAIPSDVRAYVDSQVLNGALRIDSLPTLFTESTLRNPLYGSHFTELVVSNPRQENHDEPKADRHDDSAGSNS